MDTSNKDYNSSNNIDGQGNKAFFKTTGNILESPKGSTASLLNYYGPSKALFLSLLYKKSPNQNLIVLPSDEKALEFYEEVKSFLGVDLVHYYPSLDPSLFSAPVINPELRSQRFEFLKNLTLNKKEIFVLSIESLIEKVIPKQFLKDRFVELKLNEEYLRDDFLAKLYSMGYKNKSMVEEVGDVSVRGDIIDIFPPTIDHPLRLEFYGDLLETIKTFDELTQRSLKSESEALILPACRVDLSAEAIEKASDRFLNKVDELGIEKKQWEEVYELIRLGREPIKLDHLYPFFFDKLSSISDYLLIDSTVTFIDRESCTHRYYEFLSQLKSEFKTLEDFKDIDDYFFDLTESENKLENKKVLQFAYDEDLHSEGLVKLNSGLRDQIVEAKSLDPLIAEIRRLSDLRMEVIISVHSDSQAMRMEELLLDHHEETLRLRGDEFVNYLLGDQKVLNKTIIITGVLKGSIEIDDDLRPIAFISEEDIFGKRSIRKAAPSTKRVDAFLNQLENLNEGDLVVHGLHGIGYYKGLVHMEVDGIENDFIILEYADEDKLYIPVQNLDVVTKYKGPDSSVKVVEKLGSGNWEKAKKKVKKAVQSIAGELIKLYSVRLDAEGFEFKDHREGHASIEYKEFEATFEFEETNDQLRAINETLEDMASKKVMDRLVCGDVGYGKTEVAMRAAFLAAISGKQTVILVPTTVLAQQHYRGFEERFKEFPINIGILSRFRTKAQIDETVKGLKDGTVDIVIGTHRLLQKDIILKDLGLIIIDEEHRFGVSHKEKLKQFKGKVDVLTLTATPIPRTLQMAFSDLRDLSIITTPPQDRIATTTRVIRFDEELIKEAILREIERGGQVFFVHNRIDSIYAMEERLKSLIPSLKIAVAHGRLTGTELERVMVGFVSGDFDLLLATSIIESGLDISRANTIIINKADKFGLSDLYQLRGRVGRSYLKAFAYLVTPDEVSLSKDALKRIEVMKDLTELGSGFRLATHDLEIRGAGELLGSKQSGNMAAVGFDTYVGILEESVREIRGDKKIELNDVDINIKISNFISEDYIKDRSIRLNFYKKIAMANDSEIIDNIRDELMDRFSTLTDEVENLLKIRDLKIMLKGCGVRDFVRLKTKFFIGFDESDNEEENEKKNKVIDNITDLIKSDNDSYGFSPSGRFFAHFTDEIDETDEDYEKSVLKEARYLLKALTLEC